MARQKRLVVPGVPHHITQRGNNRQTIFRSDADRRFYLAILRARSAQHGLRILGYCLMSNHIHLVAIPNSQSSMALTMGQTHMLYAQRFNLTGRRSGHVVQGRYHSSPLGPDRVIEALVYTDMNPVRARMIDRAQDYPWSSAAAHILHSEPGGLLAVQDWSEHDPAHEWRERLAAADPNPRSSRGLRRAIRSGLPYGDDAFLSSLEKRFGRPMTPRKPGPKPDKVARATA